MAPRAPGVAVVPGQSIGQAGQKGWQGLHCSAGGSGSWAAVVVCDGEQEEEVQEG